MFFKRKFRTLSKKNTLCFFLFKYYSMDYKNNKIVNIYSEKKIPLVSYIFFLYSLIFNKLVTKNLINNNIHHREVELLVGVFFQHLYIQK